MSKISVDVSSARIPVLQVGYQGENEVTDVLFDISSWITEFGEGVAQLRVKRPGNSEEESYVLSLTITDGIAVWTVSETDTFNKGNGKVQLSYLVGNIVKKAVIYPYKVGKSIVGADNPVDPFDSWIERSKAWAIGETLDGDNVPETDETYQNNAKYYAEQADTLGSAQVVLATEQATLATAKATLATEKADAAAASEAAVNGVSTQLTTRMSAIETEQAVQDARMDTFTSLPEGSTSGNAELADIRVGADGTTYDTAGNAVRGQISGLKSDLDYLKDVTKVVFETIIRENIFDSVTWTDGYVNTTGASSSSDSYKKTSKIAVSEGDTLYTKASTDFRFVCAYSNGEVVSSAGAELTPKYTVPSGVDEVVLSVSTSNLPTSGLMWAHHLTLTAKEIINTTTEEVYSTNLLNVNDLEFGKFCSTTGSIGTSSAYCYTKTLIPVNEGDVIGYYYGIAINDGFRYVTAYDENKNVLSDKGSDESNTYTVPAGVSYIRVSLYQSRLHEDSRLNINGCKAYEPFYIKLMPKDVMKNSREIENVEKYPLTKLPSYMLNMMAYKPLGALTKGYICLVSDDGTSGVNTYTIPMVLGKGVPCTFAIMKSSEIMQNDSDIAIFKNALANGCKASQHGGSRWTEYDEYQLTQFFDSEKEFFDSQGIDINSAVCPAHYVNKIVSAVAGGRFGVCRNGYDGEGSTDRLVIHYDYYCNGARSNLYALSSRSAVDGDLNEHKSAIDYAKANKMIYILLWHENELTNEKKLQLEGIIDYAKEVGITFCTLDEIPYLT